MYLKNKNINHLNIQLLHSKFDIELEFDLKKNIGLISVSRTFVFAAVVTTGVKLTEFY